MRQIIEMYILKVSRKFNDKYETLYLVGMCLALRVHLSESAHQALMKFPGFQMTRRGETSVKVIQEGFLSPTKRASAVKIN